MNSTARFDGPMETSQGYASLLRKAIHIAMAAVPLAGWLIDPRLALILAAFLAGISLLVEVLRHTWPAVNRLLWRLLPSVFRAWEQRRILGSTWFALGMLVTLLAFGPNAGGVAVLFLAWGDPAAEIVGRKWGAPARRKTLVGSAACFVACLLGAAVATALSGLTIGPAAIGALAGTAVERWSPPPDDNLWIPLLSGLVTAAAIAALRWLH